MLFVQFDVGGIRTNLCGIEKRRLFMVYVDDDDLKFA